jgi:hypothetical protein
MRFDISGKAQRVIPRKFFRKFGVALFECFNDRQMFGQRRGDAFGASATSVRVASKLAKRRSTTMGYLRRGTWVDQ